MFDSLYYFFYVLGSIFFIVVQVTNNFLFSFGCTKELLIVSSKLCPFNGTGWLTV
jgi:hypothetical protein